MATASAFSYTQTMRRPFRLNRRRVLSLGFMVAALLGGLAYLNGVGQQPTYPVLIAARDVARGALITANDLQPQRVALPDSMAAVAVPASALSRVVGQRLAEPVHAGVPLLEAQVARPTELVTGFQRVAFPVGPEHAAGAGSTSATRCGSTSQPTAASLPREPWLGSPRPSYPQSGIRTSVSRRQAAPTCAPRSRGKLAWIEVLVDDAQAGGFLQILAAGDPDVTVLPPAPATSTPTGALR